MSEAGFSPNVLTWFRSYLDRYQTVKRGNGCSDVMKVNNGIAHGTLLGPILFIFDITDLLFAFDCNSLVRK